MLGQQPSALPFPAFMPSGLCTVRNGLPGGYQVLFAVTDQITAPHLGQRLPQHGPVFRIMVAQESLMQATLPLTLYRTHRFAFVIHLAQRILARVIHGSGRGHRRGVEGLYLIRP